MRRIILALLVVLGIGICVLTYVLFPLISLNRQRSANTSSPPQLVSLLGILSEEQEYYVTERSPSGGYLGEYALWFIQPEGSGAKYYLAHSGSGYDPYKFYHTGDLTSLRWDTGVRFNVTGYIGTGMYELYRIHDRENPHVYQTLTIIRVVTIVKL